MLARDFLYQSQSHSPFVMILPVGAAVSGSGLRLQPLDIRIKRIKIQAKSSSSVLWLLFTV